jgi:hypothetical protein
MLNNKPLLATLLTGSAILSGTHYFNGDLFKKVLLQDSKEEFYEA